MAQNKAKSDQTYISRHSGRITGDFFKEWNEITPQTHIRKLQEQMA